MLEVAHVVRRYGPVGGMERYVWELTHALSKLGVNVTVVCEKCFAVSANLNLHKRTHTKDKRYQCKTCDKKFIQNQQN